MALCGALLAGDPASPPLRDTAGGTWVQVSTVAPIVNSGDSLDLGIYATIALGQSLLVDDVSEVCA